MGDSKNGNEWGYTAGKAFSFSVNVDCITLSVVLHFVKFSVKEPANKFT